MSAGQEIEAMKPSETLKKISDSEMIEIYSKTSQVPAEGGTER